VSAADILKELPRLSAAERQILLERLHELSGQRLQEQSTGYASVNLRDREISEAQAADLRARLKTFAEDWDRPEASIYDENPAR
jgi:hypothetical protein